MTKFPLFFAFVLSVCPAGFEARGQILPPTPPPAAPSTGPVVIPTKVPTTPSPSVSLNIQSPARLFTVPPLFPSRPSHVLLASAADLAAIDPAKTAEIRKLLALTGSAKILTQMNSQVFNVLERQHPEIPPHIWRQMEKEMDDKKLLDQLIPVYDHYFTLEDLKAIDTFYGTQVGKRMLATMPLVMRDSMQLGQEWARNVATKIAEEMKEERGTAGVAPGPFPATAK